MIVIHRPNRVRLALLLAATAAVTLLAGCAPTVALTPAADAGSPRCADVTVRLPDAVAGLAKRETDAQATGAWGSPASVLLRCGVADPGPTTLPCVSALGIDWVIDDSNQKAVSYVTFGRDPAIEVVLDHTKVSDSTVLADLQPAISTIPQTRKCLDVSDVNGTNTPVPEPTDGSSPTATP